MSSEQHDSANGPKGGAEPARAVAGEPAHAGKTEHGAPGEQLSSLMAGAAAARPEPDLGAEALAAARKALHEGNKALAEAEAGMEAERRVRTARGRERLLRLLLAVNLAAMVVVLALPATPKKQPQPQPAIDTPQPFPGPGTQPQPQPTERPGPPALYDPWNQALAAADRHDWNAAIKLLEQHLADSPRMAPSVRLNVLLALEHYCAQAGRLAQAQEYHRRAEAHGQSHTLPEDLVAMAREAEAKNDQESLRRIYARFLLQQRQIPSWLYQNVAEAYLKLGDSYRIEAQSAAEAARRQELEATARALREQAALRDDKPPGEGKK